MKVLIIGGYGVFGGYLARALIASGHDVIVAGRSKAKAETFVAEAGGTPLGLDASDHSALEAALRAHAPECVVDAAGPFQAYAGYAIATAAIAQGAHYLDLSDDAAFTAGITDVEAGDRVVLSGVSSVPALSAAAVRALAEGLAEIAVIESAILPGNRAPRGRSVMAAILAQAGAPLRIWRGGQWRQVMGWSGTRWLPLLRGVRRPGAFIGAPDLALFPEAFGARSVLFRAGLELRIMHYGLALFAGLRRLGLIKDLTRLLEPLHAGASLLQYAGTARGGMVVRVGGRNGAGRPVERTWRLLATKGDGPKIPAIPAEIVIGKVDTLPPGARPALDVFTLAEAEAALTQLNITCETSEAPSPRLFEEALGARWDTLPDQMRQMHDLWDLHVAKGTAKITRGAHPLARLVAWVFRFPDAAGEIPVTVTMERRGETETWMRDFGGQRFCSTLSKAKPGHVYERFGPFKFLIELTEHSGGFGMEVRAGWLLGLPIPKALLPVSDTIEHVKDGRFTFDVRLSVPVGGLVVHYQGLLTQE